MLAHDCYSQFFSRLVGSPRVNEVKVVHLSPLTTTQHLKDCEGINASSFFAVTLPWLKGILKFSSQRPLFLTVLLLESK